MNIKQIALLILFTASLTTHALMLPKGCKIQDINQAQLTLKSNTDALFFIQNNHTMDLYLVDSSQHIMTTKLSPSQWSVLAAKKKQPTIFQCVESRPGSEQRISCQGLMTICQISPKKAFEDFNTSHWAVEDTSLEGAGHMLIKKHIPHEVA